MGACALIIGLFAVVIGGPEQIHLGKLADFSIWVPITGIFIVLIPVILMIYVLMCLIASRKPGGKTVLIIFLLWIVSIIACSVIAIRENVSEEIRRRRHNIERVLHSEIIIDRDTTTLEELLDEYDGNSIVEEGGKSVHITVPSKSLDILVDKNKGELKIDADGRRVTLRAEETDSTAELSIHKDTYPAPQSEPAPAAPASAE